MSLDSNPSLEGGGPPRSGAGSGPEGVRREASAPTPPPAPLAAPSRGPYALNSVPLLPPHAVLVERLRARLASKKLPGHAAHLAMAPLAVRPPESLRIEGKSCREAAVLVLLVPGADGETAVVLTARRPHLRDHAGQISFPGGRVEPGETHEAAARREGFEEVGLPPERPDVLGALTPLYIPPSNFCVFPFVAALGEPFAYRPQEDEVAAVLEVPLAHVLDPANRRVEPMALRGASVEVPFFRLAGRQVWGATAMMLAELAAVVEEAVRLDG